MLNHKFSIITVNLNNKTGLHSTILSVIAQTYTNYEFIIIDGASSDGSIEIIKKYEKKISKWISENDCGVYHAMNKGIKAATGEFLYFLNSGDTFYSNQILQKLAENKTNEYDLIYGDVQLVGDLVNFITVPIQQINFSNELFSIYSNGFYPQPAYINKEILYKRTLQHQSVFFKKCIFDKRAINYNEKYTIAADYDLILWCFFKYKAKFHKVNVVISNFDCSGISSIQKEKAKKENDTIRKKYFGYYYWWIRQTETQYKLERTKIIFTHPKYTFGQIIKFMIRILPDRLQQTIHSKLFKA